MSSKVGLTDVIKEKIGIPFSMIVLVIYSQFMLLILAGSFGTIGDETADYFGCTLTKGYTLSPFFGSICGVRYNDLPDEDEAARWGAIITAVIVMVVVVYMLMATLIVATVFGNDRFIKMLNSVGNFVLLIVSSIIINRYRLLNLPANLDNKFTMVFLSIILVLSIIRFAYDIYKWVKNNDEIVDAAVASVRKSVKGTAGHARHARY